MRSTGSRPRPGRGSRGRSPSRRRLTSGRGRPSARARTRWSSRLPVRARRWPRSCGRSTSWRRCRRPQTRIRHAAQRLGLDEPDIKVAVRTGDTAAEERRKLAAKPPDILITTPESLFLLLTSQARETLRGVETVIVDEVHAVAGTKRGAHLALSLERLDDLLDEPAQRIGLSATVRPVEEVARFLGGIRPVEVVAPGSAKEW